MLLSKTTATQKTGEVRLVVSLQGLAKRLLTICAPDCLAKVLRSTAPSIGSRSTVWAGRRQRLLRVIIAHAGARMIRVALICHPLCIILRHVGIGRVLLVVMS